MKVIIQSPDKTLKEQQAVLKVGQTWAVGDNLGFAADPATQVDDFPEEGIKGLIGSGTHRWIINAINHDIDVDIAVPGMPETGNRHAALLLQALTESDQLDQPAPWHDDVLIELCQAGGPQAVTERTAYFPDGLTPGLILRPHSPIQHTAR